MRVRKSHFWLSLTLTLLLLLTTTTPIVASIQPAMFGQGKFFVTGYTCPPFCFRTFSGTPVREGVAAVDPTVIPLGSKIEIEGLGTFIAEDTGSGVLGNMIDVFVINTDRALTITGQYQVRWYQEAIVGEKAEKRKEKFPNLLITPTEIEGKPLCLLLCSR